MRRYGCSDWPKYARTLGRTTWCHEHAAPGARRYCSFGLDSDETASYAPIWPARVMCRFRPQ